jgi:hypothetical protein
MARWLWRLIIGIAKILAAALILLVVISFAILASQAREVRRFCESVQPGTPASSLPEIASAHGVNPRWVKVEGSGHSGETWRESLRPGRGNAWRIQMPNSA